MRLLALISLTVALVLGFLACEEDGPTIETFCERLERAQDLDEVLASLDPAAIDLYLDRMEVLEADSPSEIRSVATLRAFAVQVAQAISSSPGSEEQAVETVAREADLAEVEQAGEEMQRYSKEHCGITLTTVTTGSTTTTKPSTSSSSSTATTG